MNFTSSPFEKMMKEIPRPPRPAPADMTGVAGEKKQANFAKVSGRRHRSKPKEGRRNG